MPRPRTPISELEFYRSPNLARSKGYAPPKPLAKRAELEALYEEVKARRDEALADVKKNGLVIEQDKFNGRKVYLVRVVNPAVTIAAACERQLVSIARLLNSVPEDPKQEKSTAEMIADFEKSLGTN